MAQPVRIVLREIKQNKSGESPLYIRVISRRKIMFMSIGYSLRKECWDEAVMRVRKNHPNHQKFNTLLTKKIAEVESLLLESELKFKKANLDYVKEKLKGKNYSNFFTYAEDQIQKAVGKEKINSLNNCRTSLSKLYSFHKSKDLRFDEITIAFLEKYEKYLREELGNKTNTVHNNIKYIRKWIKQAIREKLFSPEDDPFINFKIKKEKGNRVALTEDEIHRIECLALPHTRIFDVRNMFLFSYLSAGIRVADTLQLKWKNISDGKLYLTTQKTGKQLGIKLSQKAIDIINYYKNDKYNPEDYIFPFLDSNIDYSNPQVLHNAISSKTALANKHLREIAKRANITGKKLSNHIARHSFASISLKKEIPIKAIADLMGHSTVRTTEIYAKTENLTLDSYMDKFGN